MMIKSVKMRMLNTTRFITIEVEKAKMRTTDYAQALHKEIDQTTSRASSSLVKYCSHL